MDLLAQHEPCRRLVEVRGRGVQGVIAGGRCPHGFHRYNPFQAAFGDGARVKNQRGRSVGAGNLQEDLSPAKVAIIFRGLLDYPANVKPLKFFFDSFDFVRAIAVVVLLAGEFQPLPRQLRRHGCGKGAVFSPGRQLRKVREAREPAAPVGFRGKGVIVGVHCQHGGGHASRDDAGHEFRRLHREGVGLGGAGAFLGLVRCTTQTARLLGRRGFLLVTL